MKIVKKLDLGASEARSEKLAEHVMQLAREAGELDFKRQRALARMLREREKLAGIRRLLRAAQRVSDRADHLYGKRMVALDANRAERKRTRLLLDAERTAQHELT